MPSNTELNINEVIANLIDNNIDKLFAPIKKGIKREVGKLKVDLNFAFKTYLEKAYDKYSRVKTLLYKTEPKYLYDFFECNILEYNDEEIDASNINNVLEISKCLIIKGTGGIGKTTLMRHFFINALTNTDLIPLFVELKDLKKDSLFDCIYRSLEVLGFSLGYEEFKYALESGCFIFLFDGYDEILNDRYEKTIKEINDFCDKYNDNHYIISSRPIDSFISLQKFTVIESLPFNKEQAINLIKRLRYDEDVKARFLRDLENNLYDEHESFASNPLLLTMMLLTFENYAEIPNKKHIFYSNAFDTLYSMHDATKGYKRVMKCSIPQDSLKQIFSKFCFLTFIQQRLEFEKSELEDYLKQASSDIEIKVNCNHLIYDLVNSICLIYREGNIYRFAHRSFQEYFTALYIKNSSDDTQIKICSFLIKNSFNKDDVINMLYSMDKDRLERNIILPILQKYEEKYKINTDRYLYFYKLLIDIELRFSKNYLSIFIYSPENLDKNIIFNLANNNKELISTQVLVFSYPKSKKFLKKIYNMIENKLLSTEIPYTNVDILSNLQWFDVLKKTRVGKIVLSASNMLNEISARHNKADRSIDDLLKSVM